MNKLSSEEIKHISKLASLALAESEIAKFGSQLTNILDYVDKIATADTDNVAPLSHTTGSKNIFREDQVQASLTQKQALANSSSTHKGYFKVRQVLEK